MNRTPRLLRAPLFCLAAVLAIGSCGSSEVAVEQTVASATVATTTEVAAPSPQPPVPTLSPEPQAQPSETAFSADRFVDHYGCGHGFAIGSDGQDLGLTIHFAGDYSEGGPDVSSPVEWPNADWVGEVWVGSDLFSNWCNDMVLETDPVPAIAQSWTIVHGVLNVSTTSGVDCDGTTVTGELTDAVLRSEAGEELALDTLSLRNDAWGCFAG